MMFSRAASLRRLASPGSSSLLRPAAAAPVLRSSPLSTTARRAPEKAAVPAPEAAAATAPEQVVRDYPLPPHLDPAKVKRPTEIPFQPEVANTVHLVGTVGVLPVLEQKSPGEYEAVSVIVEKKDSAENDSSQLWIPVIFQGDLAQIAACHLKENDLVYIVGQLSGDEPTTKVKDAHYKIWIFARSLSFVESNSRKDDKLVSEQDKKMASDHSEEKSPTRPLWNDLLFNPHNWWDNRATMTNPTSAAFKHKDKGQLLWLNEFTPEDVLSKLDTLAFYNNTRKKSEISGNVKDESQWTDVFANPGDWKDNRINKQNGTVKPRYPDFTHKSSRQALWLGSAPGWVQLKLDDLKTFGSSDLTYDSTSKNIYDVNDGKKTLLPNNKKDEDLWKDFIENPTKWWDNRLDKRNPRAPDFKHKDSGEVLWLNTSPTWVLEKLPPAESATNTDSWAKPTSLSSGKDLWKDVVENPTKWWDKRLNKRNPRAPDFKHKDSGVALWLDASPSWVLEKLPPAESAANTDSWAKVAS